MAETINIELVYALPEEQVIFSIALEQGVTVQEAVERSKIVIEYPQIDLKINKVGIFGKMTKLGQVLRDKDRIEIYRPLIADPKEVRRKRAAAGKKMKKGNT
ncbi:MAG: RnfH family protein [Thiotrichaceae bacterium]|nr:RnfH family protein [Thiotrichaceae bacterium]